MRGLAIALLLACAPAPVLAEPASPPPAVLDHADALASFTAALATAHAGSGDHPLRISWFGDSLTADDQITGELRRRLQSDLGDGGAGFVFAQPPHPMCEHRAIRRSSTGNWHVHGASTVIPGDHLLGLGGDAESTGDGGTITLEPLEPLGALRSVAGRGSSPTGSAAEWQPGSIDVHYLAQPGGGTFELVADGHVLDTIGTREDTKRAAFAQAAVPAGTKRIQLRTRGRVRLFGATLEAEHGAVVDNLGIINGTAKALATFDLPEHFENQLAHRAADLVIIMFGTNEAEWLRPHGAGMAEHEKLVGALLATVRAANPVGSCLVISPLDQLDYKAEVIAPRTSVPALVEAQRRAAIAAGCAFWDAYAWMGGSGASREWFRRGWLMKDYQHPTTAGAGRIADALYSALVGQP